MRGVHAPRAGAQLDHRGRPCLKNRPPSAGKVTFPSTVACDQPLHRRVRSAGRARRGRMVRLCHGAAALAARAAAVRPRARAAPVRRRLIRARGRAARCRSKVGCALSETAATARAADIMSAATAAAAETTPAGTRQRAAGGEASLGDDSGGGASSGRRPTRSAAAAAAEAGGKRQRRDDGQQALLKECGGCPYCSTRASSRGIIRRTAG